MDAFLSADAARALRALSVLPAAGTASGLLVGHKRAGRVFVESAFPAPAGFRPTPENFPALDSAFVGRVVGFFVRIAGTTAPAARRPFLQPLACGRLLLEITPRAAGGDAFRAYAVEFDGRFRAARIALRSDEPPEKRRGRRIQARNSAPRPISVASAAPRKARLR